MGQVGADLVGAAGHKLNLQQRQTAADSQRFVAGDDLLRAAGSRVGDAHNAALGVLQKVVAQQGGGRIRAAEGHAEIPLFNVPRLDGGRQKGFRSAVLLANRTRPLVPVSNRWTGARLMGGVRRQLRLHAAQYAVRWGRFVAIHRDTRGLVGHDQIIVLS